MSELGEAFFQLHSDLPREGPGDADSLEWAMDLARVPRDARILDAGCGPGADVAVLLARANRGHVTAVDAHAPFVDRVRAAYATDERVTALAADMLQPGGPYDFIWCASAIYSVGIEAALTAWRSMLAPGSFVAFSEPLWLTDTPSAGAISFWAEYPDIGSPDRVRDRIEAAGFRMIDYRTLPDEAWEAYYTPQEARIAKLRPGADAALTAVLDEAETEISGWRKHHDEFAYAVFVTRPE